MQQTTQSKDSATIGFNVEFWPRQLQAFNTQATELLFGGATEGGKSFFVRNALIVWCLKIPNLQCVLIRKKYDDILSNHVEGPYGFRVLLKDFVEKGLVKITDYGIRFEFNNSLISFQHCQDERQFTSAQGVEKHVLIIDEATQISERLIRFFRTWVRMDEAMSAKLPDEFKGMFPRIIYTANPIGVSVPYFRRNFVEACPKESIIKIAGFKRQYLLSRYTDNLSINEEAHKGRLEGLGDAAIARALDEGDWNCIMGEFFPEWDESRHVVTDFKPPHHWFRFRSMDLGYAEPFCVLWWAISDGEVFYDDEHEERWFPRGALICYKEWYGCNLENPAKGIRLRNEDIRDGIISRSELGHEFVPTLTDSLPFQDRGGLHIPDVFYNNGDGFKIILGDTSRVTGWAQMRDRLIGKELYTGDVLKLPMIYFVESCKYCREYVPSLPRHPSESKKEDAAEHGESTHAPDAIRLACMAHTVIKEKTIPTEKLIEREIRASTRPTVKKILGGKASGYFN